jgi:hypothetical protein
MRNRLLTIPLIALLATSATFAQWDVFSKMTPEEQRAAIDQALFGAFKKVDSFGSIVVESKGAEDGTIPGLESQELNDYLRLRFRNNFAAVPFTERNPFSLDAAGKERTGQLWCGVWTVGKDYPIAYHVECKAGTMSTPELLSKAVLGYGSRTTAPDAVKKAIDQMVESFAVKFFKVRGQL